MSLRRRFLFLVVGTIIFFGAVAIVSIFFYTKSALVEKKQKELGTLMSSQSLEINEILENSKKLVQTIATQDSVRNYLKVERNLQNEEILQRLSGYNINGEYSAIYLLDTVGNTLVSTDTEFVGKNYSFRAYFKEAISGKISSWHALGVTSEKMGYYFASPVKDINENIIGVAVVKLNPESINNTIEKISSLGGKVMFTDNLGIILYSNKEDRVYKTLGKIDQEKKDLIKSEKRYENIDITPLQYDIAQQNLSDDPATKVVTFFDAEDNEDEIMGTKKVGQYPFYLIIEQDFEEYVSAAFVVSYILSLFVFLAVLGTIIILSIMINTFLKPLELLQEAAIMMSKGNFKFSINENFFKGELKSLAKAFNLMVSGVRNSRIEVEEKVEKQVKEIKENDLKIEKQQRATLNILEDVQAEKIKVDRLAKDLEKFQLAVAKASDHIVITDEEGIILYMNKAAEEITGFSVAESIGKKAGSKSLWGGRMEKVFYEKLWKTIKKDKKVFIEEIKNMRKNGEEYDALASISPIIGENGLVRFFVGIERDITKLKEVDRAKTEFVSLASHQLRTPLTAIKWNAEIVLEEELSSEVKEYVTQIYQSNERMIDLVNALLNVSRIDMGTFAIDPKEFNPLELVESVIGELEFEIVSKKLKIKKNFNAEINSINTDQKLLRIIVQNLLSNAIKYTNEKGKVAIEIKKDGDCLNFSVSDSGIGIPKKQQARIFSKLFRAENAVESVSDGTGLGLYVTKAVVEQLGGKINFKSIEKKGTTFFFSLPIKGIKKKEGNRELSAIK